MGALLLRYGLPLLALGIWVYALVDAISVPEDSMYRAGNKLIWVLVILLAPLAGALIYLAIGRPAVDRPRRRRGQIPPDDII
jgi:Phospholipase_D-nuclease N-terminal